MPIYFVLKILTFHKPGNDLRKTNLSNYNQNIIHIPYKRAEINSFKLIHHKKTDSEQNGNKYSSAKPDNNVQDKISHIAEFYGLTYTPVYVVLIRKLVDILN